MYFRKGYIYVIINKTNGKYYYGKTFDIKSRWIKHKFNASKKINRRLYDSMNYHGYENFSIHKISEIECDNTLITEKLNKLETHFIKLSDSQNPLFGYNMTSGGDGGCSEETKHKISRTKMGQRPSIETRKKMSGSCIWRKNKNKSYEEIYGEKKAAQMKNNLSSLYEGKTYEELHGIEEANRIKKQKSKALLGKKRPAFSEEWKKNIGLGGKGKTWEDKVGVEQAKKLKEKKSNDLLGNKRSFKEVDLILAETLLKKGTTFTEVAKILNISITTFNYKFREKYNMTPYQYSKI
jgi:group I intron endonuclease